MGALVFGGVSPVPIKPPERKGGFPQPPPEWVSRAARTRAMHSLGVATNVHPHLLPALQGLVDAVLQQHTASRAGAGTGVATGLAKSTDPGPKLARKLGEWGLRDLFRMDTDLRLVLLPVVAVDRAVCAAVFSWSTSQDLKRDVVGDGGSLLHYFARHGTAPGFDPLTWIMARDERYVLDTDQANARGETPLMCAAGAANLRAVKALLLAKARTDLRDAAGKTAVFHAVDGATHGPQWFECFQSIIKVSSADACTLPRKLLGPLSVQTYARKRVAVV